MSTHRRRRTLAAAALLLVLGSAAPPALAADGAAPEPDGPWPGGARAAVSLGYDDGLDSHLDHVAPLLNRLGLRASFYLPLSSPTLPGRLADWRAVAAAGHELGNHSLVHPCHGGLPGRSWVLPHRDLARMTAEQMRDQVRMANTALQAIDGQTERTYTPPCLDLAAAGGENYVDALAPLFAAMRTRAGGLVDSRAALARLNPAALGTEGIENLSGAELIARVQAAAARGTLVSFTFHGVGAEYLSVSREAHDALLQHLAAHRTLYWTDSAVNVARRLRAWQALASQRAQQAQQGQHGQPAQAAQAAQAAQPAQPAR